MTTKVTYKLLNNYIYCKYFFVFFVFFCVQSRVLAQNDTALFVSASTADTLFQDTTSPARPASKAIDSRVDYSAADSIIFDIASKRVTTFGASNVKYQAIDLTAEVIEMGLSNNELRAFGIFDSTTNQYVGLPVFKDGSDVFDSDSMRYNFRTKQGLAFGIFTQQNEGFLHGGRVKIHANREIHIHRGKYTTCDERCPHFYVEISKGKVIPDDKILFGPAWIVIDEITLPIVIPFGYFPITQGRMNGIIVPSFGDDRDKGFFFREGGYYLGIGDFFDIRLTGDVFTFGSWRAAIRSNYVARYKFTGSFDFEYASLVLDEERQDPTFQLRWNHQQDPKSMNHGTFSANVNFAAASHSKQNSYDTYEYLNTNITSGIAYSKEFVGTPFRFNATMEHSQNNRDSTISLTLPRMRFSMGSQQPFKVRSGSTRKERFYNRTSISYSADFQNRLLNAKMDDTFFTSAVWWDAFRNGLQHQIPISTNFRVLKHITITPSFNYTERWYTSRKEREWDKNTITETPFRDVPIDTVSGFYRVWDFSTGVSATTKIFGMYQFKNQYVQAVRHVVTPTLSYNFTPDFSDRWFGYYDEYRWYDEKGKLQTHQYSYYSYEIFGVPNAGRKSAISLSINNNIEAKIKSKTDTITGYKKVKIIESLSIGGSYNFAADTSRGERKMSLISVSGYTTLVQRISIRYSANFDPYVNGNEPANPPTNKFILDRFGTLWRTDDNWNFGASYSFNPIKNDEVPKRTGTYSYFDMPWNLSLSYNLSIPRQFRYNEFGEFDTVTNRVVQTLGVSGNFSLTKQWRINFSTGWDFQQKGISFTTLNLNRNLHCWEMLFTWVPMGTQKRWEFTLRVKADMLKDVKYNMRSQNTYF
ncbi:MAG: hypothetical protein FWC39_06910 [Bacteroidetes bacterium]|nr:hypothetical protein [Bacteroidota bacterium]